MSGVGMGRLAACKDLFHGAVDALQAFTLDADYKGILDSIIQSSLPKYAAGGYTMLVLVLAPIVGGAAVLAALANVFPILKFRCVRHIYRNIYIFSYLNEQTLYMARELYLERNPDKRTKLDEEIDPVWPEGQKKQGQKGSRICLVFANTWVDEGKEDEANMVAEAKAYGAICVSEDLSKLEIK